MTEEHRRGGEVDGADDARGPTGAGPAGEDARATRREVLVGALAASAVALSGLPRPADAQPPPPAPPASSPLLQKIGEISWQDGKLRATITVQSGQRLLPTDPLAPTGDRRPNLRYFEGRDSTGKKVWPPDSEPGVVPPPLPGPTLRARVGDQVEITYLNHIDVEHFAGSIDRAERGDQEYSGCDGATTPDGKIYPDRAGDGSPNCFHGSSTVNLHFHGTHVTPDGLGDNVLLQLRPNRGVTEESVRADFARIFEAGPPTRWSDLPRSWRERQLRLLQNHDDTAAWRGKRGTPGHPALPPESQLLPPTLALIRSGNWPQYQIGAYPFCFILPKFIEDADCKPTHYQMGQCPGTHWYHAHKHGSTAINVLNGMAGVFVIEGDYDDTLVKLYPNLKRTEKVMIVQNFSDSPKLLSQFQRETPHALWVNGQYKPTIIMSPGEIQLWRFVNASVRAVTTLTGFDDETGEAPLIRQIAQDGVQFHYENFKSQRLRSLPSTGKPRPYNFAPGNRVDLLVKAPMQAKSYEFKLTDTTQAGSDFETQTILILKVEGEPVKPAQDFPTERQYPHFPCFLKDIEHDKIRIRRELDFGWEPTRSSAGLDENHRAPRFVINDKLFENGRYDQTMVLGDAEEWTLTNSTRRIAHPFHIHVNPFQVVEVHDPTTGITDKPSENFIWQDVIAIPPARYQGGQLKEKGYVKIRHRFVDFPGSYVLHCHMLAHEDRGMMQLVRVIPGGTVLKHH